MKSRFIPYATTPGRLTAQLVSDLLAGAWITLWVLVGLGVHRAIAAIAGVGTQVKDAAPVQQSVPEHPRSPSLRKELLVHLYRLLVPPRLAFCHEESNLGR
jgi:hypothetical protein